MSESPELRTANGGNPFEAASVVLASAGASSVKPVSEKAEEFLTPHPKDPLVHTVAAEHMEDLPKASNPPPATLLRRGSSAANLNDPGMSFLFRDESAFKSLVKCVEKVVEQETQLNRKLIRDRRIAEELEEVLENTKGAEDLTHQILRNEQLGNAA